MSDRVHTNIFFNFNYRFDIVVRRLTVAEGRLLARDSIC